jgi:hypothetical protein
MTDHSPTNPKRPSSTQISADDMVRIVRRLLEAEGRQTTRRGRAVLRAAYEKHIKSFDRPDTEESSSEEEAARKLLDLAKESDAFAGFSRAGHHVMEMMVLIAERQAKVTKVCPAWPFC